MGGKKTVEENVKDRKPKIKYTERRESENEEKRRKTRGKPYLPLQ